LGALYGAGLSKGYSTLSGKILTPIGGAAHAQRHEIENTTQRTGIKTFFLIGFFPGKLPVRQGTSLFYLIISHIVLIRQV
jgi:hypothetical protein